MAVVGGGPAGMMAAGRAAELGAKVVLLEKNQNLGKKLLITGKGRCNITQAEFDDKKFIQKLNNKKGKFLFSALAAFGSEDTIQFFEKHGLQTKIERGGRVFPVADESHDVLDALIKYLKNNKVKIMLGADIESIEMKNNKIAFVKVAGEKIYANNFILATGGKSYPATGSTGVGYQWAGKMGHTIIEPVPALVPIKTKEDWVNEVQGLSLKNVEIRLIQNNKKQGSRFGEMLFTHFGLSGPIVLDASKKIGELLKNGEVIISIDLKPALSADQLDTRLQRDFSENKNKDFKNYLPELLPQKIIPTILNLSGIEGGKKINLINKKERIKLGSLLKDLRLTAKETMGFGQAIITSGGVDLKEVDSKTMRSKKVGNLFFAGEIIDLDGPTGGYNLQICWSTGFAAGTYVGQK